MENPIGILTTYLLPVPPSMNMAVLPPEIFHTAIRAGLIDRKLPICDGAPNPSTTAMARRLLCSLVERSRLKEGAARSVYPLVNTINAGVNGVVEFFSQRAM
jgi:hypothetical protein